MQNSKLNVGSTENSDTISDSVFSSDLKILAHQGRQGEFPPHSFPAIRSAFLSGAQIIEFDVYKATDKHGAENLVVIHPEGYYLYVTKGEMMQNEKPLPMSYEQTREFTIDGEPLIPSLEEVLDLYVQTFPLTESVDRPELHIELKGPGTAEVVIPLLQDRIERGLLRYEDFLLTGLCYRGEEKLRIEIARELDPDVRLVLVLRGQDLTSEGFADWDEVLATAKELKAEVVTPQRRFLTPEIVEKIKSSGFQCGTYHLRTSDELDATISLGADIVAADYFLGPSISDYALAKAEGSTFFRELSEVGFYGIRDWIWEIGWHCESLRKETPVSTLTPLNPISAPPSLKAGLIHNSNGDVGLQLPENGALSNTVVDFSDVAIPGQFCGQIDLQISDGEVCFKQLLSNESIERFFTHLTREVAVRVGSAVSDGIHSELAILNTQKLINLSNSAYEFQNALPAESRLLLKELADQFLTRTGRILGMLAFTAAAPRFQDFDNFSVLVDSPLTRESSLIRSAAEEQLQAQLLRSGKKGTLVFVE